MELGAGATVEEQVGQGNRGQRGHESEGTGALPWRRWSRRRGLRHRSKTIGFAFPQVAPLASPGENCTATAHLSQTRQVQGGRELVLPRPESVCNGGPSPETPGLDQLQNWFEA